ncbi:hypothetical protein [Actinotalea sp. JY-7885]|uniref:hypothetical protein n=1 Tax=Actinotalea sp. JY-7885 TaxID=2758576 RepID=UPI00165E7B76|nr:hypothetical protein [Actinotalea sp. JY-7885]
MPTAGWIVLVATLLVGGAMIAGAVALSRNESRKRRIQLPARLVTQQRLPAGNWMTVEFPGPDGAPRTTTVFSAFRRGLGATPMFSGSVWVDADDPSDVIVRPRARSFWPVFLTIFGSVLIAVGIIVAVVLWGMDAINNLGT